MSNPAAQKKVLHPFPWEEVKHLPTNSTGPYIRPTLHISGPRGPLRTLQGTCARRRSLTRLDRRAPLSYPE